MNNAVQGNEHFRRHHVYVVRDGSIQQIAGYQVRLWETFLLGSERFRLVLEPTLLHRMSGGELFRYAGEWYALSIDGSYDRIEFECGAGQPGGVSRGYDGPRFEDPCMMVGKLTALPLGAAI